MEKENDKVLQKMLSRFTPSALPFSVESLSMFTGGLQDKLATLAQRFSPLLANLFGELLFLVFAQFFERLPRRCGGRW